MTLEKIRWLCNEGEQWLKPEHRSSGAMMFYKKARVEYHPVGSSSFRGTIRLQRFQSVGG